jgi:hypothetical protein
MTTTSGTSTAASAASARDGRFAVRVLVKAAILFALLNIAWALLDPLPVLGRASLYNTIVPGRERLPFGENPAESYNLSLYQLEAMFASHEITRTKPADEFRVIVIGDSSVWGILLTPDQTIVGGINARQLETSDGRSVRAYNLGYPTISVTKDLLILSRVMQYDPDLIVWPVTLEAMPLNKQLSSPIVQNNADEVRALIDTYDLDLDANDPALIDANFWQQTIVGQRREIADVVRLNLYGFRWASTSIDQVYPDDYTPAAIDLEADDDYYALGPELTADELALDELAAGIEIAGDVPVLLINEPILISSGENSDIRYNFYYPRWAYDDYRALIQQTADERGWRYLDLWDIAAQDEFTNSAIHLTPDSTDRLAERIADALADIIEP